MQLHSRQTKSRALNSSSAHLEMERLNFTHGSFASNKTPGGGSQPSEVQADITLPVFMFAGGAVGNLIAIIVLSMSRTKRKSSAFYTLLCGLAVTDLLGTCLASPLTLANYMDRRVLENRHACGFHSFLLLFFGLSGLSIICAMAAERYGAICCPYTYRRIGVDRGFAQRSLLFIGISHIIFCSLPMMGMAGSELQTSHTWCFIDWRTHDALATGYSALYGVASLLLILGTILLNLAVCCSLLVMRQRTTHRPGSSRASVRQRWRALSSAAETKMIAVLVMTSVVVLACSAPLVVRVFANCLKLNEDHLADLAAIRIASVNPILDPWIYILLRRSLFRRLLALSLRLRGRRPGSLPPTHTHLFCPDITKDGHVFTQLMCNTSIITQLPAASKVNAFEAENQT